MIIHGDCLEKLKELEPNSVDAVVTDPPYGLSFMGKKWDYDVPRAVVWVEVLRVLKPGGHLLSFNGTRTYHVAVCEIESAGFEIRDQTQWLYGSGFPKSMDVSKAIDKAAGAKREVIGVKPGHESFVGKTNSNNQQWDRPALNDPEWQRKYHELTAPATDSAKQWQGWGTALKPANEPIVLARKPLSESTVAKNVLKWGTGALNIDGTRIAGNIDEMKGRSGTAEVPGGDTTSFRAHNATGGVWEPSAQGRWPANLLLDESAAEMLDAQSGVLKRGGDPTNSDYQDQMVGGKVLIVVPTTKPKDCGGASRFFYCAKTSKRERNAGLEGMPYTQNFHPTVKPMKLMEYLIKLITPPGGIVLDPFMGSGSTGVAAKRLGFEFIGIEMNDEYVEIAEKRIANV